MTSRISARISGCLAMLSVASQAKLQGIAVLLLPFDQMRQHVLGGLAIADEIVVDEIDHRRMPLLPAHGVELGGDLRGVFSRGCRP